MASKKTVIIGATDKPGRYAFLAAQMLKEYGHPIVPMSIHKGQVSGEEIIELSSKPPIEGVDTVTMYINPLHQEEWADYIISLTPKRVIFNPGSENQGFIQQLNEAGIESVEACTLVMLRTNQY
ncbi:CoA-binding protein [Echinicola marina]|uniref:CoA-binding protein n=1 Tax=Echinicola marina TaxID=2859768 RepID=UPI001CF6D2E9|nr:CoA-binding protein [Echinicola marina]UCS92939.1 CoA-binding protein [Echinicola marina]